jgi:hypothetical protein
MLSSLRSRIRLTTLVLAVGLAASATALADAFDIFSPALVQSGTGKTYPEHAAAFWVWALSQPTASNPLIDPTGENCDVGQSGPNWYLAGAFAGAPVARSCSVPAGKNLIVPVFNSLAAAFPTDPPRRREVSYLRKSVSAAEHAKVELEIDGVPVDLEGFYEESAVFSVTLPEDNIFGLTGTDRQFDPAVDAGYYVAIAPLPVGLHTIHTYGKLKGSVVDVTWEIEIQ